MNTPLCGIPATGASIGQDILADRWNRVRHPSILTETGDRSLAVANTYFIDSRRAVPLSERPYAVYRIP